MARRHRVVEVAAVMGRLLTGEAGHRLASARNGLPDPWAAERARARAIKDALERLGPLYIKVGQILSTRPDLVSPEVIDELSVFHEHVLVRPFSEFEPVLEANLGCHWRSRFRHIDTDHPLGAGSMAQVYRAVQRSGREVVIKVQRPGVAAEVALDMDILARAVGMVARAAPGLAELFQPEAMLETVFTVMRPEIDFMVEADNIDHLREILDGYNHIGVPEVIKATREVLVMTMAPGTSILEADMAAFGRPQRRDMARDLVAMIYKGLMVDGVFHADPHPGNIFVSPDRPATLIDFGMVGRIDQRLSLGFTRFMLAMGSNDGEAAGRAALELSTPTARANVPAFLSDMQRWVPSVVGSSLGELNFGRTFNDFLLLLTRRGIAVNPSVAIIGKVLSNLDGSVRLIAAEVKPIEVFESVLGDILRSQLGKANSQPEWLHLANASYSGGRALPEQVRALHHMVTNGQFVLRVHPEDRRLGDARAVARTRALCRTLLACGALVWLDRRRLRAGGTGRGEASRSRSFGGAGGAAVPWPATRCR
ncbi:MAG: ABC1 kinase family protein [Acidimicrobiia bacterium]